VGSVLTRLLLREAVPLVLHPQDSIVRCNLPQRQESNVLLAILVLVEVRTKLLVVQAHTRSLDQPLARLALQDPSQPQDLVAVLYVRQLLDLIAQRRLPPPQELLARLGRLVQEEVLTKLLVWPVRFRIAGRQLVLLALRAHFPLWVRAFVHRVPLRLDTTVRSLLPRPSVLSVRLVILVLEEVPTRLFALQGLSPGLALQHVQPAQQGRTPQPGREAVLHVPRRQDTIVHRLQVPLLELFVLLDTLVLEGALTRLPVQRERTPFKVRHLAQTVGLGPFLWHHQDLALLARRLQDFIVQ
jgi:hypothetical protein